MKFISWNVNGLRACIQKGFLEEFNRQDADFFCLQETKLSAGQLELDLPGYEQYWCYAEKKGYSGTAVFTKHTPLSVSYGIGVPELDNEGRVITLEYREFYLVTCYTPNAQRGLARIEHRMAWDDAFRHYLQKLDAVKPVILCGDLNVAHQEIDLKNPASNRGNAGFSDQERESFQKTLELGFTDTFRYLYPDATGRYSWWSYMFHARENNAGWRIDYFLVSDRLRMDIRNADIYSQVLGSDHCPVMLELDTLVNGAIWSPTAGTATVVEAPVPEKKKAKASPVNGKALALLCFLLAFVITLAGLPSLLHSFTNAPTEPVVAEDVPFTIRVCQERFSKQINLAMSFSSIIPYYPDRLSDGDTLCYVESYDVFSLESSNFWLRLELTDYGHQVCTESEMPYIRFLSHMISSYYPFNDNSYSITAYYADVERTQLQGWLIWGKLYTSDTLLIGLDSIEYYTKQELPVVENTEPDETVSKPSTGEYFTVQASYTPPSIQYLYDIGFGTPRICINTGNDILLTSYSAVPEYWDSACFWYTVSLTDEALEILQGVKYWFSYDAIFGSTNTVICVPYYTDYSLSQIGGWFLYGVEPSAALDVLTLSWEGGNYTYPYTLEITPYIGKAEAKRTSSFALCRHILTHPGFHELVDSLQVDLRTLMKKFPALEELAERDDAVFELMNYPVYGNALEDEICATAFFLLHLDLFRAKMSPSEEALLLLNSYPTCPYTPYDLNVESERDLPAHSTESLLVYLQQKSPQWEFFFLSCSSYESREAMYRILRYYNPIALELETRDDLDLCLRNWLSEDNASTLASYLLELLPVMKELNGTVEITEDAG